MYKTRKLKQFPVFGPEGDYIDRASGGTLVDAVVTNIQPSQAVHTADLPVSYTGDPDMDVRSENGGAEPASGNKMLIWLGVGGIALFALFGKNMLKAGR